MDRRRYIGQVTPERRAKLIALGELRRQHVAAALPSARFTPSDRPGSKDYNIHYVDLDADDAFQQQAMAIFAS